MLPMSNNLNIVHFPDSLLALTVVGRTAASERVRSPETRDRLTETMKKAGGAQTYCYDGLKLSCSQIHSEVRSGRRQ